MRILGGGLITLALMTGAMAEEAAPDLKGKWTGTFTGGVRFGGGQLAPTDTNARFVKPGERDYTLAIDEQDGRGLKGTWSSVNGSEPLQGVIRLDNKTILFVDEDSYLHGMVISATEIELCNQTVNTTDRFSFCFLLKKQ